VQTPVALCIALEKAINAWLALDEENLQRLESLKDRVVALTVSFPEITLYFIADHPVLRVQSFSDTEPDVHIIGSAFALTKMSLQDNNTDDLFSGDVQIHGDTATAQAFQELLSGSGIDWEEHLSHIIGDVAAHNIGQNVRHGKTWLETTRNTIEQDVAEYLKNEIQLLPQPDEVRQWLNDVDILRNDIERLNARVQRLQNRN
jgi:ubiquinone biosynthesis protein UbiJ